MEPSNTTLALLRSLQGKPFPVSVHGISMNPTLWQGDEVLVQRFSSYTPGDILVYDYGKEGLLIHCFLYLKHGLYHCRGDNTVRIERIAHKRIIGKVLSFSDGRPLPACPEHIWKETK